MAAQRDNVRRGMSRIALGWPDGIDAFAATNRAFLISLAPPVAVNAGILLSNRGTGPILAPLLLMLCSQLMPLVVSFELARGWGREARWLRYATALNWSYSLCWIVSAAFIFAAWLLTMGYPAMRPLITVAVVGGFVWYLLWLHWFLARHGLDLSAGRAVLVVLAADFATGLVLLVALLLAGANG